MSSPTRPWATWEVELALQLYAAGQTPALISIRLNGRTRGAVSRKLTEQRRRIGEPQVTLQEKLKEIATERRGWPVPDRRKELPIGFFADQNVSQATLDRELSVIGRRMPSRPNTETLRGRAGWYGL